MNRTSRAVPTVGDVMTSTPRTIAPHQPIATARRFMKEYEVRCLPVTDENGKLVGIVSERDLHVAQAVSTVQRITVEDIMAPKPYIVSPDAFIHQVVKHMVSKKQESAVAMDRGRVLGVFTTTDALRVLADTLEGKLPRAHAIVDAQRRPGRPKTRRIGREALA